MTHSLKNKLIGDKSFYKMVMAVAVPIMIQNGITNFVGLLDNIMVGLIGTEPAANYVQIAGSTQFVEGKFTATEYAAMVKAMFEGTITVSNDIVNAPALTNANVEYLGNIK